MYVVCIFHDTDVSFKHLAFAERSPGCFPAQSRHSQTKLVESMRKVIGERSSLSSMEELFATYLSAAFSAYLVLQRKPLSVRTQVLSHHGLISTAVVQMGTRWLLLFAGSRATERCNDGICRIWLPLELLPGVSGRRRHGVHDSPRRQCPSLVQRDSHLFHDHANSMLWRERARAHLGSSRLEARLRREQVGRTFLFSPPSPLPLPPPFLPPYHSICQPCPSKPRNCHLSFIEQIMLHYRKTNIFPGQRNAHEALEHIIDNLGLGSKAGRDVFYIAKRYLVPARGMRRNSIVVESISQEDSAGHVIAEGADESLRDKYTLFACKDIAAGLKRFAFGVAAVGMSLTPALLRVSKGLSVFGNNSLTSYIFIFFTIVPNLVIYASCIMLLSNGTETVYGSWQLVTALMALPKRDMERLRRERDALPSNFTRLPLTEPETLDVFISCESWP